MLFLIKKQAGISRGGYGTAAKLSPATAGYLNHLLHRTRKNHARP